MLNLIVNGARVSYDSLEEAKDAARESGLGLAFWRETLSECAENEAMWNEFLNDLWQSGAEDEAERLDRTFPKGAPRHWLLVALTLGGDDPWEAFLAEWNVQGDGLIFSIVRNDAFMPWLKQVKREYFLFLCSCGDILKIPQKYLLRALKVEGEEGKSECRRLIELWNKSIKVKLVRHNPVDIDLFTFVLLNSGEEHVVSRWDKQDIGNVYMEMRQDVENPDSLNIGQEICFRHLDEIRRVLFVAKMAYTDDVLSDCRTILEVHVRGGLQTITAGSDIPRRCTWYVIACVDFDKEARMYPVNCVSEDRPTAKDIKWIHE